MPKKQKAAANGDNQLAQLIIDKAQEQIGLLAGRNWPEIKRILDKEEEIAITFKVQIVDRNATPGEQADKDNRLKTTISFAEKYSDNIDGPLPDPEQPELPSGEVD